MSIKLLFLNVVVDIWPIILIEKVYHCKDFEELLNFVRIKQTGDRGVTYINRSIGLILKNVK